MDLSTTREHLRHQAGLNDTAGQALADFDALVARVAEMEAVIRESIRNHRVGCPCPRCDAVGGVLADPKLIRPTGFLGNINGPGCDPDTH